MKPKGKEPEKKDKPHDGGWRETIESLAGEKAALSAELEAALASRTKIAALMGALLAFFVGLSIAEFVAVRRARHGYADRQRLCPRRHDLPRFPRELRPPRQPGKLVARPGLPRQQAGSLGGQKPPALDPLLVKSRS